MLGRIPQAKGAQQRGGAQIAGESENANARDGGPGEDPGQGEREAAEEGGAAAGGTISPALPLLLGRCSAGPHTPRAGQAPGQLPGPTRRHELLGLQ